MPCHNRALKFPCCSTCLEWQWVTVTISWVTFAGGTCWMGGWLGLPWLRCYWPLGSRRGVLHSGQVAGESAGCVGWGVWAGLGGAGMGKLQDCQGVWTVWGCSSEMVGDCFISRIPAMWRKGAYVLQGVGWWPLYLNQDAFEELHAESILTAWYLQSPYLA